MPKTRYICTLLYYVFYCLPLLLRDVMLDGCLCLIVVGLATRWLPVMTCFETVAGASVKCY